MAEKRNRGESEQKLIHAVHAILLEKGFQAVGINAVAEHAGLNKVLIYRYFGGIDGLLAAYAEQMDPFPGIVEKAKTAFRTQGISSPEEAGTVILDCMIRELTGNGHFLEMLKWELTEKNPLSESIAASREANGLLLFRLFSRYLPENHGVDVQAATALLTGGIFYLFMRAGTAQVFNGIPIGTREGRERLLDAGKHIISSLFPKK